MLAAVIRDADDRDFDAGFEVIQQVWPRAVGSVAGWRHAFRAEPEEARRRYWAAEQDGRIVGWATAFVDYQSAERPGGFRISVVEEHRGRGVGGALYDRCLDHLAAAGVSRVDSLSQEGEADAAFLRARGFRHRSTVTVSGVDPAAVAPGVVPEGIELRRLAQLAPELVFALDVETSLDLPNEEVDDLRYEQWLADFWRHPDVDLESSVAAVADGVPVSFSLLEASGDRGMSGMTGTLRSHRGRGLAELVKRATLGNAAARGVRLALTHNDETNAAMLRVNAKLGYTPVGSLLGWRRG
ncbi:MAG: family N-acetyltransferase [Gaiellaceae bacterium]|jgi:GNAT superfamily N-acetyltransferase|nr:family N-acetyltransferase [Gaiellaceae bacterium]